MLYWLDGCTEECMKCEEGLHIGDERFQGNALMGEEGNSSC